MAEAKDAMLRRGFHLRGVMKTGCALLLLLFGGSAITRNAQAQAPATPPLAQTESSQKIAAGPPKISYIGGQLRIDALDSTLGDVLTKVGALLGVSIDVPAGANSERMPFVELGPGPARQVLASLLSDSNFDYLIQASGTDPEKIQNVLVMAREKKGGGANATDAAVRPVRSPFARGAAQPPKPEEAPASEIVVTPAPPENAQAEAPPEPEQPTPPPPTGHPLEPGQSNVPKTYPVPPPANLTPQTINQQLQQMYQQRMQMQNPPVPPGGPGNPGGK